MLKNGICYVVGAGACLGLEFQPSEEDLVIAADAGLRYLEQSGIAADLIIGDFDTLGNAPAGTNVITLSCEKDDTDMLAAVREGIKAGYTEFHLYGGTGGRIDHTIGVLSFSPVPSGYISVFSYSEKSEGVYLQGLKYPLADATLTNTFPIGTSNEFIGEKSRISVKNGTLMIVFPKEAKEKLI